MSGRPAERLWTGQFVLLMSLSILFFFGFQLVVITVPLLAVSLGGGNAAAGLVMGAFTLAAMMVRPVTGWALDAYGRRALFLFGAVVVTAAIFAHELVAGVAMLLVLRFIHGAGFGITTTASNTLASDLVPRSRLGEGMGFATLAMSLPMAIAPSVGLALAGEDDFTALFLLAGGLSAVSLALGLVMKIPRRAHTGVRLSLSRLVERTSLFPAGMMLLLTMTYGVIIAFIALYGRERGIDNVGPFFTVYAVVLAVARPLSGRIADRFGYERTAAVGLAVATVGLLVLSMADSLAMFLVAGFAYGFAFGMAHPSLQALVIYLVSPSRRGSATATFYTAFDLGVALGSVGGGFLSGSVGLSGVYLLAAGVSAIGTVCLTVYAVRRPPTAPALMGQSA